MDVENTNERDAIGETPQPDDPENWRWVPPVYDPPFEVSSTRVGWACTNGHLLIVTLGGDLGERPETCPHCAASGERGGLGGPYDVITMHRRLNG